MRIDTSNRLYLYKAQMISEHSYTTTDTSIAYFCIDNMSELFKEDSDNLFSEDIIFD